MVREDALESVIAEEVASDKTGADGGQAAARAGARFLLKKFSVGFAGRQVGLKQPPSRAIAAGMAG